MALVEEELPGVNKGSGDLEWVVESLLAVGEFLGSLGWYPCAACLCTRLWVVELARGGNCSLPSRFREEIAVRNSVSGDCVVCEFV